MKTSDKDILDSLILLAKHKKSIVIPTLIVSILAVVYILLVPEYWVSYAKIRPESTQATGLSMLSSSDLGISGMGSSLLGSSASPDAIDFVTVLNSRTFSKKVINKFNLVEYFEIDKKESLEEMELAIEKLNNEMKMIGLNDENSVITIQIESKDPELSAKIANYYWKELENYNLETRMTKAKRKRIFLEDRLEQVKINIDSLTKKMNYFKNKNDIVEIENQTKAAIELYSTLASQKINSEIELQVLKENQDDNSPLVERAEQKLKIINEQIAELETKNKESNLKYNLSLDKINDISSEYMQLLTRLEIQKKVYETLYPQFEQAKIEEVRDLPTIEVIDVADIQGLRSKPNRAIFCIVMFLLALLLSSAITYTWIIMKQNDRDKKVKHFFWYLFHKK
jgi:uncharacterized protein involved in exopolysaccharide biosynthesis